MSAFRSLLLVAGFSMAACVEGSPDVDANGADTLADLVQDTSIGEVDAASEVDAAGEVDAADSSLETTDDAELETSDAETEADIGCAGCLVDGVCVAPGEACPDAGLTECFESICIVDTCSTVVNADAPCGAAGCQGVCTDAGECFLPETGGCNSLNLMFVSSTPATLVSGLSGLDGHCSSLASQAGLPDTNWVAWASIMNSTVAARIGSAQAWIRPDGKPVAQTLDDLLNGRLLYPPLLDEYGVEASQLVTATGTTGEGEPSLIDCGGFNPGGDQVTAGHAGAGTSYWTQGGEPQPCSSGSLPIVCLQVEHSTGLVEPGGVDGRLIFVTDDEFQFTPGGGLEGADEVCQSNAEFGSTPAPPGIYKAYLRTSDGGPAISGTTPLVRADGLVVFEAPFDQQRPNVPISQGIGGFPITAPIWLGTLGENNCADWTSTAGSSLRHIPGFSHEGWDTITQQMACGVDSRIICYQEVAVEESCDSTECAINGGCLPAGPVTGLNCLSCDPSYSRFVLKDDAGCE